jgi:5-carboxymethyl-2-hydroxymuconate isomerase
VVSYRQDPYYIPSSKWPFRTGRRPFKEFTVAHTHSDFIDVFGNIMEGRTPEQKSNLSRTIVTRLKELPDVPVISMNVREFEKAVYCNRHMV